LLSFDGNRHGGLPKRFTRKNPRMVSIRKTQRRNLTIANLYVGWSKYSDKRSPGMLYSWAFSLWYCGLFCKS